MSSQAPPRPANAPAPAGDGKAIGQVELKKAGAQGAQGGPPRGRDTKLQQLGRQTISTLYMLVRNVKMYDPDNDIFIQPFENLRQAINTIVAVDGAYGLNAVGTTVYINGKQIQLDFASIDNVRFLTEEFKTRDVGGFNVTRPVQVQELKDFIWIFSPQNDKNADEDGAAGRKLLNIKVGKFARIQEQLDKQEDAAIEAERKVDRKKYAMTVYARAVFYMRRFIERLQSGGQLPSMQPAQRLVQDFVDICVEQRSHFLGMTTTRAVDEYLMYHSVNTCLIAIVFGHELGLSRAQMHELGLAALFHDIGIAEIDQEILNKRRTLTKEERRKIDLFPLHTVKTLLKGRSLDQQMIRRIIASYEAKVDYSMPMKDQHGNVRLVTPKIELGLYGSIINVAACYDALTSARPFRESYGPEVALTLMTSDMMYKFDPFLIRVFMKVMAIQPVRVLNPGQQSIAFG
jgi:HD-GYP domain-containing protein (c-di-GMP phosphodiesterase class II)